MITCSYSTVDGYRKVARFKTLAGARKFCVRWVGERPYVSLWGNYAVSDDGVGKVTVSGDASLLTIFPHARDDSYQDEDY